MLFINLFGTVLYGHHRVRRKAWAESNPSTEDNNENHIRHTTGRNENFRCYRLEAPKSEKTYLEYLYDQGRSNVRGIKVGTRHTTILMAGRRSGKSWMALYSLMYEIHKAAAIKDPRSYYGITDKSSIGMGLAPIKTHEEGFNNSILFHLYNREHQNVVGLNVMPPVCINVGARRCASSSNMFLAIDEADCWDSENTYKDAIQFKDKFSPVNPDNPMVKIGESHSRVLVTSTPSAKPSFFRGLFDDNMPGMDSGDVLCLRVPTWEMNPLVPADFIGIEKEFGKARFLLEFGAEW